MPNFKHDCGPDCCQYIGSTTRADFYLSKYGTVIIRHSDEGSDYLSTARAYIGRIGPTNPEWSIAAVLLTQFEIDQKKG